MQSLKYISGGDVNIEPMYRLRLRLAFSGNWLFHKMYPHVEDNNFLYLSLHDHRSFMLKSFKSLPVDQLNLVLLNLFFNVER